MSTRWEIDEYVEDDGRTPIRDFVAGLEPAERGRLSTRLEYVREEGLRAGAHVLKNLRAGRGDARGKLWELRLENSPNNPRILSFATAGRTLVLLHGFRKTGRPDDRPASDEALPREARDTMSEKAQANPQGFMTWLQRSVDEHPEAAEAARDERIRLHLARALRQAREAAGMTQELLAGASGLKQAMVSRLEQADHNPTVATVLKYVSALPGELVMGVTVGDSLFGATPACDRTVTLPAHAVDEANRLGLGPREYVLTCVARDQSSRELGALVREEIRANMREMRSWTRATGDAEHEGRPKASFEAATHGKAAHYPVAV